MRKADNIDFITDKTNFIIDGFCVGDIVHVSGKWYVRVWQGIKGLFLRRPIITSGTYKVTGVEDASITITKRWWILR